MVDKASGGARPFYELPSHIKPCSQIIQETRLQLKYSRKGTLREVGVGVMHSSTMSGDRNSGGGGSDAEMRPVGNVGGMRPVNTQRPFTPRDNSLWGVSARKRPPSAITLSRLSIPIEDIDFNCGNSNRSCTSPSSIFGRLRGLEPKNSLGSLSSHSGSLAGIAESDFDDTCLESSSGCNGGGRSSAESSTRVGENNNNVEKTRLQMKSLSLQNVTSREIGTNNECGDMDQDLMALSKKARHSDGGDGDKTKLKGLNNGHVDAVDSYQHINNLEVAIEYLSSFVQEYSTSDKPPKADIISILKKIRQTFSHGLSGFDEGHFSKLRKKLLELIFKLVEKNQNDENILFWASFILLHCNIIGNNLTTVFKMVFKSSKSLNYKDIILGTEYLDVLMKSFSQICPKSQTESMIYGYGTLKFLCGDISVLNRVVDLNLIPIMALHLKILNCEMELCPDKGKVSEGILNGTFQLTSILRSVVGESKNLVTVVQSGLMEQLCTTMTWALCDIDVLTNIMRILSVVSMDGVCCQVMYNNDNFCPTVIRVLHQYYDKDDIMVRLAYCLGNLLANSDDMRVKLFEEPEAFQCLLKVMSHYLNKTPPSNPSSIDILIKTTRVLANWILNPFVGSEICDESSLSNVLYATLKSARTSQELILCVMCALNNTSFYINYTELDDGTMKTAEYLFQNLTSLEVDVRAETVKVLGNLTRNKDVRLMSANYMDNILSSLDDSETSDELFCATLGVLINVVIEKRVKVQFLMQKGVERVIRVLEKSNDIMVALITCQVIWNLLISHENQGFEMSQCISPNETIQLKNSLNEKLNKIQQMKEKNENIFSEKCTIDHGDQVGSCNCNSTLKLITEDFVIVAGDLVAKL